MGSGQVDERVGTTDVGERPIHGLPGLPSIYYGLIGLLIGGGALTWGLVLVIENGGDAVGWVLLVVGFVILCPVTIVPHGLFAVAPGEARVVQLFGRYVGTVREPGLHFVNPLARRRRVSTRVRNHETMTLKVNDVDGNPIEIAAVVVWQVEDTAKSVYQVDDCPVFVGIQADTAVRFIAGGYPYGRHPDGRLSLQDNTSEIAGKLTDEIQSRVALAGVKVVESRLTRLAYAPEIAQAMLRSQQATAIVAARQQIVEGAVGMVQLALDRLDRDDVVELDEERKAAMVSNLLVVLCSDHSTQPIVNAGSLYQ